MVMEVYGRADGLRFGAVKDNDGAVAHATSEVGDGGKRYYGRGDGGGEGEAGNEFDVPVDEGAFAIKAPKGIYGRGDARGG
jgi:hypothetical protein